MTWWANPTTDDCTIRAFSDDNEAHVFVVPAGGVSEIPSAFDRAVQYQWSHGSPMLGQAPLLTRVDEAVVMAAKAEAANAVEPAPMPTADVPVAMSEPEAVPAKMAKVKK